MVEALDDIRVEAASEEVPSEGPTAENESPKVNVGAGEFPMAGYVNIDRATGDEAANLQFDDGSLSEIRASHVLEHFSHRQVINVLRHWFVKLHPGGCVKIAVPDFYRIAKDYLDGKPINVQGKVMGGHNDENDAHGAIFDVEALTDVLIGAGFERISSWKGDNGDNSEDEHSLNLVGYKPISDAKPVGIHAVLSGPRFGPMAFGWCTWRALTGVVENYTQHGGVYWHQTLSEAIELELARGAQYILTTDFDSIYRKEDVVNLFRVLNLYADLDAVCALQMMRGGTRTLFTIEGRDGNSVRSMPAMLLDRMAIPVTTGHFGLTLFRAESLKKMPKPWMRDEPDKDGRWRGNRPGFTKGDGKIDADMSFWRNFGTAGLRVAVSPRVRIGHVVELIMWPDGKLRPQYQSLDEWQKSGPPGFITEDKEANNANSL